MAKASSTRAVLIYTALRVALFLLVWLTIELLTPISGIWAIVVAILVSGVSSIVLLDRSRNQAGLAAAGFFGRINERIEAAARAEDIDDDEPGQASDSSPPSTTP